MLVRMVAAAFLIRMVVVVLVFRGLPNPAEHFGDFGWEMAWTARTIATGHGFGSPFWPLTGPTALVPPGFPYLLAGVFQLFGLFSLKSAFAILSLDSLFSALTCIPLYFLAKENVSVRVAPIAAWAWVVYPFSIYYSTVVWEWALTALLFTTCLVLLLRLHRVERLRGWIGFGVLYGLTALVNPAVLSVLPFLFVATLWRRHRAGRRWLAKAALTTITVVAVLAPWTVRTYRTMHVIVPIRDNYWLEFYAGNNGDLFESNAAWAHPASDAHEMAAYQQMGETAYLAEKHRLAAAFVSGHKLWFVDVSARRAFRYWTGFWSLNARYLHKEPLDIPNFFYCSAMTVWMLRGARRLWRQDRAAALPFVILIAIFPITYYLSHASMDYRQPIEPTIVVLAVVGVVGVGAGREGLQAATA
jgi:4-amino-4-deoxy-L-arabinose transferase-like glycosyltransferase